MKGEDKSPSTKPGAVAATSRTISSFQTPHFLQMLPPDCRHRCWFPNNSYSPGPKMNPTSSQTPLCAQITDQGRHHQDGKLDACTSSCPLCSCPAKPQVLSTLGSSSHSSLPIPLQSHAHSLSGGLTGGPVPSHWSPSLLLHQRYQQPGSFFRTQFSTDCSAGNSPGSPPGLHGMSHQCHPQASPSLILHCLLRAPEDCTFHL